MSDHKACFEERLNRYPVLKSGFESLLDIAENVSEDTEKADDAEFHVIDEMRQSGNVILQEWASESESVKAAELRRDNENIVGHGIKKVFWHTTFGTITVFENVFLQDGHLIRPFSRSAEVTCRGYSRTLQRRITDFGADAPFGKVSEKLEEHYGISVPYSAARDITERHAKVIKDNETLRSIIPDEPGAEYVIAETDGTMIPILDITDKSGERDSADKRKTRKGRWKEARLTLAHPEGSVNPFFGCALGSPDEAGNQLLNCAIRSGLGQDTKAHCVGDGAPWVAAQADRVFGERSGFLIDFYHLCDYLSSASKICAPDDYSNFFARQKQLMKENQVSAVLEELRPHTEPDSVPDEKAPVRCCRRYIRNRPGQFDYKGASENNLPIGSGEIESAHRYIIQDRLKIAGAWWKEDNAQNIISLRVLRANGDWEGYWGNNKAA